MPLLLTLGYLPAMNYRHEFHAGNPADCVKHALLVPLVRAMKRKVAPLFVLDTHAGIGWYDLAGEAAERTGEWREGIGRLRAATDPALADYLGLVGGGTGYPGSPMLVRRLLGDGDRLALCELHPADAVLLRRRFAGDRVVQVHHRDGYEALRALLPPAERRALVLVDPPYERVDEFAVLARALEAGMRRMKSGVFAAWYPVKHRAPVRAFFADLVGRGITDKVACELLWRPALDPARLNGCGLLVINPPFGFVEAAGPVLAALRAGLAAEGEAEVVRLSDE